MYNLAYIHFQRDSFELSQKMIFEMVNIFPNYGEWISKSFLLLADNYIKQDDLFQAKLTLQNLIDNYDGELKEEAQRKLEEISNTQPKLDERKDGESWDIEFEQEGKVRDDLFEIDVEEEYELELNEE